VNSGFENHGQPSALRLGGALRALLVACIWSLALTGAGVMAQVVPAPPGQANPQAASKANGHTVTGVAYGEQGKLLGRFREVQPLAWVELGPKGAVRFHFDEVQRDDWSVYLVDHSRGVEIQLDLYTHQVKYKDADSPDQRVLYQIISATAHPVEPAAPPTAAAGSAAGSDVDPACLAPAPWMVNVAGVDLTVYGCRDASQLPPPNAAGWRHYDNPNGGFLESRKISVDPATGVLVFDVLVNGGGSGDFTFRVAGTPTQGVLKAGTFKVSDIPRDDNASKVFLAPKPSQAPAPPAGLTAAPQAGAGSGQVDPSFVVLRSGPVNGDADAASKCAGVCQSYQGFSGKWAIAAQPNLGVCQCAARPVPGVKPNEIVTGPIGSNQEAATVCPAACQWYGGGDGTWHSLTSGSAVCGCAQQVLVTP
jgi:hypothetical protein